MKRLEWSKAMCQKVKVKKQKERTRQLRRAGSFKGRNRSLNYCFWVNSVLNSQFLFFPFAFTFTFWQWCNFMFGALLWELRPSIRNVWSSNPIYVCWNWSIAWFMPMILKLVLLVRLPSPSWLGQQSTGLMHLQADCVLLYLLNRWTAFVET